MTIIFSCFLFRAFIFLVFHLNVKLWSSWSYSIEIYFEHLDNELFWLRVLKDWTVSFSCPCHVIIESGG